MSLIEINDIFIKKFIIDLKDIIKENNTDKLNSVFNNTEKTNKQYKFHIDYMKYNNLIQNEYLYNN